MATVSFNFLARFLLCFSVRLLTACPDVTKKLGPAFYLAIISQLFCLNPTTGSKMAIQRQDVNRVALFRQVKQGQVLRGHVISTHQVRSEMECLHRCLSRDKCTSFNYGLSTSKSRHICELTSGSRGHVFETRDGFSYYEPLTTTLPQQNACSSKTKPPCEHGGSCQSGFTYKGYRCSCPPGFLGEHCEQPARVGKAFHFPRKGVSDYAIVNGTPSLTALTTCFWINSNKTVNAGTILSYAVSGQHDEFIIINRYSIVLFVGGKSSYTNVKATDGKWHHICVTWENSAGSWNLYKDGKMEQRGQWLKKGHVIQGNGTLVLGQEQDSVGGGFQSHPSFIGEMTGVNIWSRVLDVQEIALLSLSCQAGEGDVFKWSDFKNHIRGGVQLIDVTCAA